MKNHIEGMSLKSALEHASDAVVVTDRKGRVVWSNPALTRLCGYSRDEIIGRKPSDFLQGEETDPKTTASLSKAVKGGHAIHVEILNYKKSGEPYWSDLSISPIKDSAKRVVGFIAIERDCTENHSEKNSLKTQVVDVYAALLHVEAENSRAPFNLAPFAEESDQS